MTTLGGWCQPAPGCTHTEREHVACRSRVCGCEAFGGHESVSTEGETVLAIIGATWDNGGTNQDGPRPAASTAGSSRGLARRYEGAPN